MGSLHDGGLVLCFTVNSLKTSKRVAENVQSPYCDMWEGTRAVTCCGLPPVSEKDTGRLLEGGQGRGRETAPATCRRTQLVRQGGHQTLSNDVTLLEVDNDNIVP